MAARKTAFRALRMLAVNGLWAFSPGDNVPAEHVENYGYELGTDVEKAYPPKGSDVDDTDDLEPNAK